MEPNRTEIPPLSNPLTLPVAIALLVGACTATPEPGPTAMPSTAVSTTTPSLPDVECTAPPSEERSRTSELQLTIEPDRVVAGEEIRLTVQAASDNSDLAVGASAGWQCWDGVAWVATHQLVRDWSGDGPQTIEVTPGATTTIPAIGLPVPSTHRVTVPEVAAGIYRIVDRAVAEGQEIFGFVIVEVASA